ncbi:methyltransferase domain-containing protein [Paucibacter sediminis]|uniref:Methyltransferase domain-containing protein n=1 Tax=Paucibacter sediminis TaxID=3019553 RepID=A0AA95SR38_9BURK|nr:methyltransferase domain-containing protein [Paucibacter sp. S2-9]WIT12801.1 methyltransferase domain-containing protein [Paucibacter sp. S2-9]
MAGPTLEFWQQRFESGQTPWDRGAAHPQLLQWLAEGRWQAGEALLVPGCGRGHELLALAAAGITATGLDYAPAAVTLAREALAARGLAGRVEQADVLLWQPDAPVDAVYEQTCLCALHPDHWQRYAAQLRHWIKPGGRLFALFMQARRDSAAQGVVEGPPYHCDINAMRALFPQALWDWPAPPYAAVGHGQGWQELAVVLTRRPD